MDAQRSIRIIRSNAEEWGYNPDKIGVLGFSAGGHLASTLSVHNDNGIENSKIEIEKIGSRPDFSILIYPVITMKDPYAHSGSRESLLGKKPSKEDIKYFSPEMQVNTNTPPAILIHSTDDEVVPVENSIMYYRALIKNNIPASIHVWENGGHGYGISRAVGSVKSWTKITQEWIVQRQLIKNK
jgi:acetyl esterase/lipase